MEINRKWRENGSFRIEAEIGENSFKKNENR